MEYWATKNVRLYLPDNTFLEDWAPNGHGGNTLLVSIKAKDLAILIKKDAKFLTTNQFLEAINKNLQKELN